MAFLRVQNVDSLQADNVHIQAVHLEESTCYKFLLRMHYKGGAYESYCVIQSDSLGAIDLARDSPIRGTYHTADPMGLFKTVQPTPEVRYGHWYGNPNADTVFYTLLLLTSSGSILDTVDIRRRWKHPSLQEIKISCDDIHGVIFKPPGDGPFPCIIDIQGAIPAVSCGNAAVLASEGYMVATFAYLELPNLPKFVNDLDLSIFSKHINYILSLPYCSGKLGIMGFSYGGIVGNYIAVKHPEIAAVLTINAPEAFFLHTNGELKDSGVVLKCEPLNGDLATLINGCTLQTECYEDLMRRLTPEVSIQWHRIPKETAFRVVGSMDDWLTANITACRNVSRHLQETGHYVETDLVPAGHGLSFPYLPHQLITHNKWVSRKLGLGGEPVLHGKAQEDVWTRNLQFFRKFLGDPVKLPDWEKDTAVSIPEKSKL